MSRYGLPDYGMYAALENMGNLVDSGELAARLGSIATFNREGNIVFLDDFESTPIKWVRNTVGAGSFAGYSSEEAISGGQSVKLLTGAVVYDYAQIERYFPRFATGKQGIEVAFSNEAKNYVFSMNLYLRRTTFTYDPKVDINFNENSVALYASDGSWHDVLTDIEFSDTVNLFHHLKVVIDTNIHKYVRVMVDRHEVNVEEYGLPTTTLPTDESDGVRLRARTYATEAGKVYLDSLILTQNEP